MNAMPSPLPPPRLKRGDTIGLLAPAGPIRDHQAFADGCKLLESQGFRVFHANDILRADGYLAGSEERRTAEFCSLWADPEIKALLAVRGGYGLLRLLPHLDIALIRRTPKILVGFSDISILLNTVHAATGLVTFHGPNLCSLARADKTSTDRFFTTLTKREPQPLKANDLEILKPGQAQGKLLGGNLTSLVHLLGTPHEIPWEGSLLFLEDVGEAPYRLDRMLTQLEQAGRLQGIKGLILGSFTDCGDTELVWHRVLELLGDKEIPVWGNFPTGHGESNHMLPIGMEAEMDSNAGVLRFLGPACS
jgi:muramoyltetrapeptide carboxypeptidase